MRALYFEVLRTLLNTVVCILIFFAGIEIDSNYLQAIGIVMYFGHLIGLSGRRTAWNATQKKTEYRDKFPKN